MFLKEVVSPESKFFLKSEWGPASDDWPAVSFSKRAVGRRMRSVYDPVQDFVIYVGTTSSINTPDPTHRSRLLSLVSMDLRGEFKTRDLIPQESWTQSQKDFGDRWMYAFAITKAWEISGFPSIYDYAPRTYSKLGSPENFGSFVQLDSEERESIQNLKLTEIALKKQAIAVKAEARARLLDAPRELKQEVYRMADLIEQRARASGSTSIRLNPNREAGPRTETMELIFKKWEEQKGFCGLCQRPIPMPVLPGLLQPSPDRIDSTRGDYRGENLHITHLGCNYAKNKFGVDEFEEWLSVATGNFGSRSV
jgi:hypothetical protein